LDEYDTIRYDTIEELYVDSKAECVQLKRELSYCDFCVEISTFSLPWQRGLVWHKFHLHIEIGSSRKPLFGARISYTSWVIADFLMKFTDFCYHGNQGASSENLNDSIKLADHENPHTGAKF